MSFAGFAGALLFLAIGIAELALVNRAVYPVMRWRFEKAKLTQSQGISPAAVMALAKVQSLILLPLIGLFAADRMQILG